MQAFCNHHQGVKAPGVEPRLRAIAVSSVKPHLLESGPFCSIGGVKNSVSNIFALELKKRASISSSVFAPFDSTLLVIHLLNPANVTNMRIGLVTSIPS